MEDDRTVLGIHPDRIYHVGEAADLLRLHPDSIYRLAKTPGGLKATRLGPRRGRVAFVGKDLIRYLERSAA